MANNLVQEVLYLLTKHQLADLAKAEVEALKNGLAQLKDDMEATFEAFAQPVQPEPTPAPEEPTVEPAAPVEAPAEPAEQPAEPVAPADQAVTDQEPPQA